MKSINLFLFCEDKDEDDWSLFFFCIVGFLAFYSLLSLYTGHPNKFTTYKKAAIFGSCPPKKDIESQVINIRFSQFLVS